MAIKKFEASGFAKNVPDSDPTGYKNEFKKLILDYANSRPRQVQVSLGPSSVGNACDRSLVGMMSGIHSGPGQNGADDNPWYSIVGTAVHSWLAEMFDTLPGWMVEQRVEIGSPAVPYGHCDLFNPERELLVDFKALSLDTLAMTPLGPISIDQLKVGDQVYSGSGEVCRVTNKTPVFNGRPCFRVHFDDNTSVVADADHEWVVRSSHKNTKGPLKGVNEPTRILTTKELQSLRYGLPWRIDTTEIQGEETQLPIDPYLMGTWLGDGSKHGGQITVSRGEDFDSLKSRMVLSEKTGKREDVAITVVSGLTLDLIDLGFLVRGERGRTYPAVEKHIPEIYFHSSVEQRRELVRGLMDSDGYSNVCRKQVVFVQGGEGHRRLFNDFVRLVRSLGERVTTSFYGRKCQNCAEGESHPSYEAKWTPFRFIPFFLDRKASTVKITNTGRNDALRIKRVEEVESVPVQCITVDSEDHTFLIGESSIKTHNCQGKDPLQKLRLEGPSRVYREQLHVYGLGWTRMGYKVSEVLLIGLPRNPSAVLPFLHEAVLWSEPYNQDLAEKSIGRVEALQQEALKLKAAKAKNLLSIVATPGKDCYFCSFNKPFMCPDGIAK